MPELRRIGQQSTYSEPSARISYRLAREGQLLAGALTNLPSRWVSVSICGQLRAATGVKDRIRAALDTSGIPEKGRLYFLHARYYLMISVVMMPAFIGHNSTDIHPTTHLDSGSYGPNDYQ